MPAVPQKPLIPGAGRRPVTSSQDVRLLLPYADLAETDPIRDALIDALTALLFEYQFRSELALAQVDPMRATRESLLGLGTDRELSRAPGEPEEGFRERLFNPEAVVTEVALAAGINAILKPFTPLECELVDAALDRWFVNDGTPDWHSFLGAGPNYPDRLFSDDALNTLSPGRPNSAVGGARVFDESLGRHLLVRVPNLGFLDDSAAFVGDGSSAALFYDGQGFFVGDGSSSVIFSALNQDELEPLAVYRAIVNYVDSVIGESVRWTMIADVEA